MLYVLMLLILGLLALCALTALTILTVGVGAAIRHWWREGRFEFPDWF